MKLKKVLATVLALVMVLGTMSFSVLAEGTEDKVAKLAGTEQYFSVISDAFTAENNPENKQVILLRDCAQDVVISQGYHSFYLNGNTLTGTVRVEGGTVHVYGYLAGTTPAGKISKIVNTGVDGKYPLHCGHAQVNVENIILEATEADGIALYVEGSKTNLLSDGTIVNGAVKSAGSGIVDIAAGTYNGAILKEGNHAALAVTGGTFKEDPSAFLPTGYSAALDGEVYTITKDEVTLSDFAQDADTNNYLISTKQDVINFRKLLCVADDKNILPGTKFVLTNDIDMQNETQPGSAGDSKRFQGSFDGQGFTISNFKVRTDSGYAAFFGNIQSGCTIENLTLENVDIENTSGDFTGALVGRARSGTEIKNCKVTGTVKVSGQRSTGGIIGGGITNMSGCELDAAEGSEIKGTVQVGGISGLLSEDSAGIVNTSVSGVQVSATSGYVGGIVGVVLSSNGGTVETKVSGNTVTDVTVTSSATGENAAHCGLCVGSTWIYTETDAIAYTNNVLTNVSATENGEAVDVVYSLKHSGNDYSSDALVMPVAKIGTEEFTSLASAIAAASEGDTIVLTGNVKEGSIKMPAVIKNLTIDGNGFTVFDTVIQAADGNSVNYQGLTIKNTIFDNSRFVLGGNRNGDVIYKDLTFEGNTFKNIVATGNMAAVHMTLAANEDNEYIENFKFVGNTIDGVSGSSNSAVLMWSAKGDTLFEGNVVKNVAWNGIQFVNAKADCHLILKDNEFQTNGSSVLNIASAPKVTMENNVVTPKDGALGVYHPSEAAIGNVRYKKFAAAVAAAKDGDTLVVSSGTYELPSLYKELTIKEAEGAEVIFTVNKPRVEAATVFEGVTFKYAENSTYNGLQHSTDLTYNNCAFEGQVFLYADKETFNGCTFTTTDANNYNVWTYDGDVVTFNDCTFNSAGKSVLVYHEGVSKVGNVIFNDCELNASQPVEGKAAIEVDSSLSVNGKYTVETNNTTAQGFAAGSVSGNSLWNNKKGERLVVRVDGVLHLAPVAAKLDGVEYESLQAAIDAANGQGTITLTTDITENVTIGGAATYALRSSGLVIDLAGKTLTGSVVVNSGTVEIKNGTIINTDSGVSAIQTFANTTLTDVDVTSARHAVRIEGGVTTINGGNYKLAPQGDMTIHAVNVSDGGEVVILGGTFTGPKGTIANSGSAVQIQSGSVGTIENGYFAGGFNDTLVGADTLTVKGGFFDQDPSAFLAADMEALETGLADYGFYVGKKTADKVEVVFAETSKAGVFDIQLKSDNAYEIYEFVSAELTFKNASKTNGGADMQYEISGVKDVTSAEENFGIENDADERTFNFRLVNHTDVSARPTGKTITIGQIKFIGESDNGLNLTVTGEKVAATKRGTNDEDWYKMEDGTLLQGAGISGGAAVEAKRDVFINVAFVHDLDLATPNHWANNDLTVTLKDAFGKEYDAQDISDGLATFTDVPLGRITVTLSGAGFRTYPYTTVMEESATPLVLNFWNDVKREKAEAIEEGKDKVYHNFLVGDIVMDYTVDEYDLAAVTSYYGMYDLTDADKYMRYDLNRDGNIDIIDVAYVLHTLNN